MPRSIASSDRNESQLNARADDAYTTSVVTDRSQTFIDWDVQMSPVVIGVGTGIDHHVSSEYSVSNSINVGGGRGGTVIKDKLGASIGIDYTRTWSTQTAINVKEMLRMDGPE
jgi:hypothetical protein